MTEAQAATMMRREVRGQCLGCGGDTVPSHRRHYHKQGRDLREGWVWLLCSLCKPHRIGPFQLGSFSVYHTTHSRTFKT